MCLLIVFILMIKFSDKLKLPKIIKPILIAAFFMICIIEIFISIGGSLSYKTPEAVYRHNVKNDYIEIAEGEDSCAFLYKSQEATFSQLFVLKDGDKYRKCSYFDKKIIYSTFHEGVSVDLIHIKNTNDYYLCVWDVADDIQISDNLNTDFHLIYEDLTNLNTIICIESIPYDSDYELYINGSIVSFE